MGNRLHPFRELPLVGPPTHVQGYTIGPAFYWILWAIRVVFGPWFSNLPHAGGIGEAVLHSAADALLCLAVWRRSGSIAGALAGTILTSTAAYDLCFAALVWNPPMGTTLAKAAMALTEPSEPWTIHTHWNGDAVAAVLVMPGRTPNAVPGPAPRFRLGICRVPPRLALNFPRRVRKIPHPVPDAAGSSCGVSTLFCFKRRKPYSGDRA